MQTNEKTEGTSEHPIFTCEMCEKTFPSGWSDDEALVEAMGLYGDRILNEPVSGVCDDCHKRIISRRIAEVFRI